MATWKRDDAYSCERTARIGDFAAVILEPGSGYNYADAWEIQVYDEASENWEETYARATGIPSKRAAKRIAETILEELDAARRA